MFEPRPACPRCRRPTGACWCHGLEPVSTRTRVVFLQHHREARRRLGTCRMAHLGLAGSELLVGTSFDDDPRVCALAAQPGTALLFPSRGALPPEVVRPRALVVIDGTWSEAGKVLGRSRLLSALPRVALAPERPGRYRIRREPALHCLSTVEAVVQVLARLEGDGDRFASLLAAFERMVELQLDRAARVHRPWVRTRRHGGGSRTPDGARGPAATAARVAAELSAVADRLVLVQLEVSPHSVGPEPVHVVALRPATGERFDTLLRPDAAPDPRTLRNLGLAADDLSAAPSRESALGRWRTFCGPDAVLGSWGRLAPTVLAAHEQTARPHLDLRAAAARARGRRAGGVEDTAAALGAPLGVPWAAGRAGRRALALAAVASALRAPSA